MHRQYRALALRLSKDGPASIDLDSRSLEVVCATENRVRVFDWESWEPIDEILLMAGCEIPDSGQVPLLDTHERYSTSSVIGSCRGLRVAGSELIGRACFADDPGVESAWGKVRDGHITDVSVGYEILEAYRVPDGETYQYDGRSYDGPVRLVSKWKLKELSVCPIGADEFAKARAEAQLPNKAKGNPEPKNKDAAMDKRMLAFLESRGLPKNASEDEAYQFLSTLNTKESDMPDVEGHVRSAIADERERFAEISAMGARFDCAELATEMIRSGVTIDAARAKVLEHVAAKRAEQTAEPGFRVSTGLDERDKFRAAAEDALCLRSGITLKAPAVGAQDLTGYSLREMARHSLVLANAPTGGNVMEMLGRALTVSDFPIILGATANKSLFEGFDTAEETWPIWTATGSVSDFKTHTSARASEAQGLDQIPDGVEYKYGTRTEQQEQYAIATYGKLMAITRQAIINDDLGAITDVPRAHGEAAARTIGDIVYAVLTANAAMGDGVALFNLAGHANLQAAAVVGVASIGTAVAAMKTQRDLAGLRRLNIQPKFFLAPVAIEGAAEVFFRSNNFSDPTAVPADGNTDSTQANIYSGSYFTRVYDSRLDDDSATNWYLGAAKGKTVKVFFLNGQQRPYMETRQGWSVDGIEYKVRIDAGAKAMDWRGLQMNGV